MNEFLVPANSKKSKLILGFFTWEDIIIVGIGLLLTVMLLMILKNPNLIMLVVAVLPVLISAFLVFPFPPYHNVKQVLINIYNFYANRRKYYWKGWCVKEYVKDDTRNF